MGELVFIGRKAAANVRVGPDKAALYACDTGLGRSAIHARHDGLERKGADRTGGVQCVTSVLIERDGLCDIGEG